MSWPTASRYLVAGLALATLGLAGAVPIVFRGVSGAPEFYGAFTAAIVAAIAVVLGAYYQSELTRRRDDALLKQERITEAIDLCYWLNHASSEMEFIALILAQTRTWLTENGKTQVEMPLSQFREVVSSKFFEELLPKAKAAARLPAEISAMVSREIYSTFQAADRILLLRGASDSFRPTVDQLDKYLVVANRRCERLRDAFQAIEKWLVREGAIATGDDD
jgi:hypothetical protein